jgi:hypothetical protein
MTRCTMDCHSPVLMSGSHGAGERKLHLNALGMSGIKTLAQAVRGPGIGLRCFDVACSGGS